MTETRHPGGIRSRWIDLLVVGLPLGLLYLRTASRDLGTIDSGELATACARLGIAHPTGYPMYTMLGRLAVLLWPGPPIVALNFLSALVAVAAACCVAVMARDLLPEKSHPWPAWIAGLWFGCDRVFWEQATGNEVYGLHLLLVALLLGWTIRLLAPDAGPRTLLTTAYLVGLAFAHHLSSAFLVPAMATALAFYLARRGALSRGGAGGPRVLLGAAGLALLGWSVVLYLPIRSARGPILDWGAPHEWDRFWRHAMASQYRVWMFESGDLWAKNLSDFARALPSRLFWPILLLAVAGIWNLGRTSSRKLLVLLLVFAVTVAWASSYDIHDLETYYLPADLTLVLFAALGADGMARWLRGRFDLPAGRVAVAAATLGCALAVAQAGLHFREDDRRNDHFVRTHVEMMLRALPPNAILLSRHWDALVSPAIYLQEIEGFRRDVTLVDVELLRRSWYFPQLRRRDPALLAPLEPSVAAFLEQVRLFENHRPYDSATIEARYQAVIRGIAQLHRPARPTAFTPDAGATFLAGASPVPEGLVYVLYNDPTASGALAPPDVDRLLRSGYRRDDDIHRQVIEAWGQIFDGRVRYLRTLQRTEEVAPWQAGLDRLLALLRK